MGVNVWEQERFSLWEDKGVKLLRWPVGWESEWGCRGFPPQRSGPVANGPSACLAVPTWLVQPQPSLPGAHEQALNKPTRARLPSPPSVSRADPPLQGRPEGAPRRADSSNVSSRLEGLAARTGGPGR